MSIRRKLLAIAAATALTAAAAVPAMAFENEFHGMFGLRATTGNYNTGGGTGYMFGMDRMGGFGDSDMTYGTIFTAPFATVTGANFPQHMGSKNWVEQRARIFYSAKASDDLKLVTAFEIDTTWGKSSYIVGRTNEGGALGADTVNLETKWVYLDFNIPKTKVNIKAGLQGLNDAYKSLIVGQGADAAGVLVTAPFGPLTLTGGWFRLDDRSVSAAAAPGAPPAFSNGKFTRDLLLVDAKYAVSKDIKVGGSYYYLNSDSAANVLVGSVANLNALPNYDVHIFGANAAATFGPLTIDGYGIYEFGVAQAVNNQATTGGAFYSPYAHINAFALNGAAKLKAGPGTAKFNMLYVSGGGGTSLNSWNGYGFNPGNGFISINNDTSAAFAENALGASFGNMFLLVRNSGPSTNDQYLIYSSDNRGLGLWGGSLGYDANITDKLFANVNVGMAWNAKRQANPWGSPLGSNSTYQGTEANLEVGYKLYDNLTASVQGAYVMLGGWYNRGGTPGFAYPAAPGWNVATGAYAGNTRPADPYLGRIVLNYTF